METNFQFMVDFTLPDVLTKEFMELIPYQRARIDQYFNEGCLINYALSLEKGKLWAVFLANSEMEVMELLVDMPLTKMMTVEISMLTFYNTHVEKMPAFSLN